MEQAMRRHFFHHNENASEEGLEAEKEQCHWCQIRAFPMHKQYPISIVNNVDDTTIMPTFRFKEASIRASDIEPVRKGFLSGCDCHEGAECRYGSCSCLQDVEEDSSTDGESSDNFSGDETNTTDPPKKLYAYRSQGPRAGYLRSRVLTSRDPIYECHRLCKCGPSCPNRVVEKGRQVPLQIFRTANGRGWGVRTLMDLRRGQFVDRYMGEIITASEAMQRRARSHIAQRKDVYLFALDKFSDPASLDERLRAAPLEVDGEFLSGPTRFINHSCEPNLRIFARVGDHAEKHLHDLAFFAVRDIPRGEELTFDYVDGIDDSDMDALDPEKQKDMAQCLCGSKNCRGYLW